MTSYSILPAAEAEQVEFYVVIPDDDRTNVRVSSDAALWDAVETHQPCRVVAVTAGTLADGAHGMARALLDTAIVTDADGAPLEESGEATDWHTPGYGWEGDAFSSEDFARIGACWVDFVQANPEDVATAAATEQHARWYGAYSVGMDLVLTAQHQGTGLWDRGTGEVGDRLTASAHGYGDMQATYPQDGGHVTLISL